MMVRNEAIGGRVYAVECNGDRFWAYSQPINPKTGKGWQARRYLAVDTTKAKAMWAWCKAANAAQRGA